VSTKIYNMTDTWNDNSLQYTSIKMDVSDINSAVNSRLIDLQISGFSKFAVDKLGKIVVGNIDIPKVNGLESAIDVLSAAGLGQVDFFAANTSVLNANLLYAAESLALVYNDPVVFNNDFYLKVGGSGTGSWSNTGILQALLSQITPNKSIERTFYVTMGGNDTHSGTSLYKSKATIEAALAAAANTGESCAVIVHPGEYEVQPETVIPRNCALYGYDLRVTKLRLPPNMEENNMFLLNSGVKVRGFSFTGMRHEKASWSTMDADAVDGPPKKGYAFAFNPGEYITRSPYIADCSSIHDFSYNEMTAPIDRNAGNPFMPMGQGNLYADGSVLDEDSPLRSVVVDSYTAINPNGVGYAIVNDALVQLVSVFTNWSRVGIWTHLGGQVTITNSNCSFGDYAFASTSFRYAVKIDSVLNPANITTAPVFANFVNNDIDSIITELMTVRYPTVTNYNTYINTPELANLTSRDTRTLLNELVDDLKSGQDKGSIFFTYGLHTSNSVTGQVEFIANTAFKQVYIDCWEQVRQEIVARAPGYAGGESPAPTMVGELINLISTAVANIDPYITTFRSRVEASGEQFSYAGSGVNYNSLPYTQRGTSEAPDPRTAIYKSDGGVVFATFSTEQGDTYLGEDIRVDFERSVIEGQAFSRGVQNIVLPLIVGIGG
jgi:hypothetical protein